MPVWPYSIFLFHQEMRNNELSSSRLELTLSNQLVVSFPQEAYNSSTYYHELSTSFLFFFLIHNNCWGVETSLSLRNRNYLLLQCGSFLEGNAFLLFSFHRIPNLGGFLCNSLRTRFLNVSYIRTWHQLAHAAFSISTAWRLNGLPEPGFISRKWEAASPHLECLLHAGPFRLEIPTRVLCGF